MIRAVLRCGMLVRVGFEQSSDIGWSLGRIHLLLPSSHDGMSSLEAAVNHSRSHVLDLLVDDVGILWTGQHAKKSKKSKKSLRRNL